MNIVFLLALSCPSPEIFNHTKTWNTADEKAFNTAKKRCGEIYKTASCVKSFTKVKENTYRVICSEKK